MAQPDWIALYLEEDLGGAGDITSDPLFGAEASGVARVVAREVGFVAGLARAAEVFTRCDATATPNMNDGSWIGAGEAVMTVEGPVRGLLRAERTALNLLGRMSGVATKTRRLVEILSASGSEARITGTRKTTPGFRAFEKEAIALAGGDPHRMGLSDAAMIKDNHIAAAGGDVGAAVRRVKEAHPDAQLTTEVESLSAALAAAEAGTDWILIDNQAHATGREWAQAVWNDHPDIQVEASGGIAPGDVEAYGWADRISLGALTTQARSMDFSLDWDEGGGA